MELLAGIVIADRFRLVRPLGQGGMGAVWLAQHTGLDVPCAVKFIHEEAAKSPELRARFEREAKAAAQLRSPHVVQILDHGVWHDAPYIAMEFLEGEDLEHRLHRCHALPPRDALAVIVQVGRALSKAHGAGLIHRDLKPANIFIVRDEEREIAKVLDFGVAKVKETGLDGSTKTGAVLGTPFYMSPEQARGSKAIDHRSDLWALAVVTYQCLTGRVPFMGEALGDLFVKIIVEPLPVPSQIAQVPFGFDAWWVRAAAREPAQRFQTAKELTDALSVALGVTVGDGVEIGSAMASPGGPPAVGSGTVALTPSGPITPYAGQPAPIPGGQPTPYPRGQPTPYPGGQPAPMPGGQPAPMPGGPVLGAAPTPMQQAVSVHPAPKRGRAGVLLAVVAVAAVLGSGGVFLALRSAPQTGGRASAATSAPTSTPTSTAAVATATATAPAPVPVATATAEASAAPLASAAPAAATAAAHGHPAGHGHEAPGGKALPGLGKSKTDFGF